MVMLTGEVGDLGVLWEDGFRFGWMLVGFGYRFRVGGV